MSAILNSKFTRGTTFYDHYISPQSPLYRPVPSSPAPPGNMTFDGHVAEMLGLGGRGILNFSNKKLIEDYYFDNSISRFCMFYHSLHEEYSIFSALYYYFGAMRENSLFYLRIRNAEWLYHEYLSYLIATMPIEIIKEFSPNTASHITERQNQILNIKRRR